jgi:hypothetical protein
MHLLQARVAESVTRIRIGLAGKTRRSRHSAEFPQVQAGAIAGESVGSCRENVIVRAWLGANP